MMSALGDYVHYEAKNYINYGLSKRNKNSMKNLSSSFQAYKQKRMENIKPKVGSQTLKILEERLKRQSDQFINNDKKVCEGQEENLKEEFFKKLAEISTADVMEVFQNRTKWKSEYLSQYTTLSKEEIENRRSILKNFQNKLDNILKNGALGAVTSEELLEIQKIYEDFTKKQINGPITASLLGTLQKEMDQYRYYTWISNLAGAFGEMFVAACADTADQVASNKIIEVMKGVKGDDRSSGIFTINEIATEAQSEIKKYFQDYDMGDHFELNKTQDKVDVDITVNNENVLATVKNYGTNRSVTLQKQLSLFYTLLYLNREGNFANHWLNIHAIHKDGKQVPIDKELENIIAFEVRYEGLVSGNPLKQGQHANIFVFMNYRTGDVVIESTYDILNNPNVENLVIVRPSLEKIHLNNIWQSDSAENRIAKLLIQTHQTNLHVTYRGVKEKLKV